MNYLDPLAFVILLWMSFIQVAVAQNGTLSLEERRAAVREERQREGFVIPSCVPDKRAKLDLDTTGSSVVGKNRGSLVVPVLGYSLVEPYSDDGRLKNSIIINADADSPVIAIADGLVHMVLAGKQFNTLLIIHGKYVSVYSKMGSIDVKEGSMVYAGQKVGKCLVENGSAFIEFELWENSERLDVLDWLDVQASSHN